ncbi:MAG: type IV secretory system conjugative DNA transfer family protein, partial [Oscillospiraceae bacterium]|nr:type IV secretory system conjugative DNA transfer family protein [Oscillospiraceae bacterium]
GSVSRSNHDPSQSLQMIERPLMTVDELKSMPSGQFVVMKTGVHPMMVRLKLYFKWGIQFGQPFQMPNQSNRKVAYASKDELRLTIIQKYHIVLPQEQAPPQPQGPAQHTAKRPRSGAIKTGRPQKGAKTDGPV